MDEEPETIDMSGVNDAIQKWAKAIGIVIIAAACLVAAQSWRSSAIDQARIAVSTQSRLLLSMEDTNTGVLEVRGMNHEIYFASDASCRMLGYEPGELGGLNISAILPESFRSIHQDKVYAAMRSVVSDQPKSHKVSTMLCSALAKDGKKIDIVLRVLVSKNGIFALINRAEDVSYFAMPKTL